MPSVLNTATQSGSGFKQQLLATRDVYSAEIYFEALPVMKFDQFTTKKTELLVQPGGRIVMPKYGNIKRGGPLIEGQRIQARPMNQSQINIEVGEWGNALNFSEDLLQRSFYDQMLAASMALGRDFALVLDLALRDAHRAGLNTVFPRSRTSRANVVPGDLFSTQVIKDMVEVLATNKSPKWNGDHYLCMASPHVIRGLRDDADWINVNLYGNPQAIYQGEVGRYADVRFIETTVMPNGQDNAVDPNTGDFIYEGYDPSLAQGQSGNQVPIYQTFMFGEYTVGHATSLPVELRDNGVVDFGREHALAWYAIFGQNLLDNKHLVIAETA